MNKHCVLKRILNGTWLGLFLLIFLVACQKEQLLTPAERAQSTVPAEKEQLPTPDEESELLSLYLVLNQAREESAKTFAELLMAKKHPERVGVEETIGNPLPLESVNELIAQLENNRAKINSTLSDIEKRSLIDPEMADSYRQAREFFDQLASFEDQATDSLSRVKTKEEFTQYINFIFETESQFPALIQKDEAFVELLLALVARRDMEIEVQAYDEIFRKRSGELDSPIVGEQTGQVKYEFTIPEYITQENVVVSWAGVPIENLVFGLEHPDGRRINFKVAPVAEGEYGTDVPINALPTDGSVVLIPSEEYPAGVLAPNVSQMYYEKELLSMNIYPDDPILAPVDGDWTLYVTAPSGLQLFIGAFYLPSVEATTQAKATQESASTVSTVTALPELKIPATPTSTPRLTITAGPAELAPSLTPSPTPLPTIDPSMLPDMLSKAFSVHTLEGVNGHKLRRITGWRFGFRRYCRGSYRWMDAQHLLLSPLTGQEAGGMGEWRDWTRPLVIDLRTGKVWLPPPDASTYYCEQQEWSQALGILITSDQGETLTYTPDGSLLKRYPGSMSYLSPSGTKIMAGDTWIDLRTGEMVDFGWDLAQWPYRPAWSSDETRLFQCCYNYGDAGVGTGYSFNLPDKLQPAGRGIPGLLSVGTSWVLDDAFVLIDWDFNADKEVNVPLIDPISRTYQDLHDLAGIPEDVFCDGFPEVAPGGEYVWLQCGRPGDSIGYIIHLATFQAEPFSDFYIMSWSKDSGYALINSYNDDIMRILALSTKVLEPLPAYTPGKPYAWHPAEGIFAYFSEGGHTLVVLDAKTWLAQELPLPAAFNSIIWGPTGSDIALVAEDGSLWQAQYPGLEAVEQLSPPLPGVHGVGWSPDGKSLALVSGADIYVVEAIREAP